MKKITPVGIIGAGLAGSEAALVLSRAGVKVTLYEMRPHEMTPAHTTALPAELVCSNSLKSYELPSAHALLKHELSLLKSPLLRCAEECRVPAGSALAVDRHRFAEAVSEMLENDERIQLIRTRCSKPPPEHTLCCIASGPLTDGGLASWIQKTFSSETLFFYDAIAPIISRDSLDTSIVFPASRWRDDSADYLNCPFTRDEYEVFYRALLDADSTQARSFEDARFFEACLPVEVVARRGPQSLVYGTMRPIGLRDPRTGKRPYAVCQLRRETLSADSLNMVGFQTRLTHTEQKRVFRLIPGMKQAAFERFGSIHRNSYLLGPALLNADLSFMKRRDIYCAGQLCGNEGYTESIATGHCAGRFMAAHLSGTHLSPPPPETACGALLYHVTRSDAACFSPSNINFGLLPPLETALRGGKKEKKKLVCDRALSSMKKWILSQPDAGFLSQG